MKVEQALLLILAIASLTSSLAIPILRKPAVKHTTPSPSLIEISKHNSNQTALEVTEGSDQKQQAKTMASEPRLQEVKANTQAKAGTWSGYEANSPPQVLQPPWADAPEMEEITLPDPPEVIDPPDAPMEGLRGKGRFYPPPPPPPPVPAPPLPLPPMAPSSNRYGVGPNGDFVNFGGPTPYDGSVPQTRFSYELLPPQVRAALQNQMPPAV